MPGGGLARVPGLLSSGSRPKCHDTHNAPIFLRLEDYTLPIGEKKLCFQTLSMENFRVLMRICSNASVPCGVPMVHSMRLLGFHLYIYGVDPSEVYEVVYGFLFCYTKPLFLIVISSPTTSIGWRRWRNYGGRLLEVSIAIHH